MPVNNLLNK